MRAILCLLGTILLLVSVRAYTNFADRVRAVAPAIDLQSALGHYSAQITCTFECAQNREFDLPAIEVQLGDQTVLVRNEALPRQTPFLIDQLPNILVGRNEILVQAHVAESVNGLGWADSNKIAEAGCVRIQVFKDGAPIGEETFWSIPGQPVVTGALLFLATPD